MRRGRPANAFFIARALQLGGLAYIATFGLSLALCQQPEAKLAIPRSEADPPQSVDTSDAPKIHVNSNLVVVPVTVTDHKGRVVNGLQKEHFAIFEDKIEQTISQFATEDVPLSITLVLDTSDSMHPRLKKAREATIALLNNASPHDEFSMLEFNHLARLTVPFTTEREKIRGHLAGVQTGGGTALLDAIRLALNEMKNAHHTRKAIIVVSDGEDNASHCSVQQLKEAVRETDVLIYSIGITDFDSYSQSWPSPGMTGPALLNEISKETGGRFFQVNGSKQLPEVASKIGAWLRSQYILAYMPSGKQQDTQYHHIRVKITRPEGFPRLRADWRPGYYAPAE